MNAAVARAWTWSLALIAAIGATAQAADAPPLIAGQPVVVPRTPGRFDYMVIDDQNRRLLAAHTGSRQLAVYDLRTDTVTQAVDAGTIQSVAIDVRDGKYLLGASANQEVVVVNRRYLNITNHIKLPGPVDAIAFDPKNSTLYADEAGGKRIFVIDARRDTYRSDIPIPEDPEFVEYDPVTDRLYQNIVSNSTVVVIDPSANRVVASWPAAPAADLRGLAVDGKMKRVFSAGGNGKLVEFDADSGKVVASLDIPQRVDSIALDRTTKRVYCASGAGVLAVVQYNDSGLSLLGNVTVPRGAHTLAVDQQTHAVFTAYGGVQEDYILKLTPP